MNKNLICIVSAIATSNKPLDYTDKRSAFTHQQRFEQSLQTIQSIRKNIPNSYIVFIEGTCIENSMINELTNCVDVFYNASIHEWVLAEVNSPYKGRGEAATLISYLLSNDFKEIRNQFITFSKISGRYTIDNEFNFSIIPNHIVAMVRNDNHHHSQKYFSTMFYTVPYDLFDIFIKALLECYNDNELKSGVALEHIIYLYIVKYNIPIYVKNKLFVSGEYGPWGGYVQH